MDFRTDGAWAWCDATAYYLREYGLAPDPGLLAHMSAAAYVVPHVDGASVRRALAALREPHPQPPAWTANG